MNNLVAIESDSTSQFNKTLQNLKHTASHVGTLVAPVNQVDSLVTDVDSLLNDIVDILNFAQEVDEIIEIMAEALNFLDAIPIVGEVAAIMAEAIEVIADAFQEALEALEELKSSIITPVQDVLKDMEAGLTDIRKVLIDISQDVPGYVNTIEILLCLSQIATPVADILKKAHTHGGAATRLETVLKSFNEVGSDVGTAVNALSPVIDGIDDAVNVLVDLFEAMTGQNAGTNASSQKNNSTSAHGSAQNTGDGFSRMQNAIKPVAWVLDAIFCIFKEILEPIINAILDATGLKTLVEDAADAIFAKLGVSPKNPVLANMSDQTKGSTNEGGIKKQGGAVGGKQGAATQHLWAGAQAALGEYQNGGSAGKDAVFALISAIAGEPIDPNSPIDPPNWPTNPTLNKTPGADPSGPTSKNAVADLPEIQARVNRMLSARDASPAKLPMTQSFLTTPQFKALDLPQINATDFPNCAKLVATIGSVISDLEKLATDGVAFQKSMVALGTSLKLPTTFSDQVDTLAKDLSEAEVILEFLSSLNIKFVSDLINPIEDVAQSQSADAALLKTQVPKFATAVSDLEAASAQVVANLPSMPLLEKTIREYDGWALGVHQLTQLVRHARVIDRNQGGNNTAQINALVTEIEASASQLNTRIVAIDTETSTIDGAIEAMQQGLNIYTEQLQAVSAHSELLSGHALAYARQVAHCLGVVDSIVQPLSGLMVDLNCVDGDNLVKLGARAATDALNDVGKTAATPPTNTFEKLAEQIGEKMVPLDQMTTATQTAANDINQKAVAAFKSNSQALVTALANLDQNLKSSQSYDTTTPTLKGTYTKIEKVNGVFKVEKIKTASVSQTVGNDLIDNALLSKVQSLIKALKLQRPATTN